VRRGPTFPDLGRRNILIVQLVTKEAYQLTNVAKLAKNRKRKTEKG